MLHPTRHFTQDEYFSASESPCPHIHIYAGDARRAAQHLPPARLPAPSILVLPPPSSFAFSGFLIVFSETFHCLWPSCQHYGTIRQRSERYDSQCIITYCR